MEMLLLSIPQGIFEYINREKSGRLGQYLGRLHHTSSIIFS